MATTSSKEHETPTTAQQPSWGTLEELLLVCAVNRHGTKSWDSVATEVQSRSSTATAASAFAVDCRDKFDDLKRRFLKNAAAEEEEEESSPSSSAALAPLVDELRRLRVQELRRDIRRRDDSIVSLELKVKTLENERDRSLKDEEVAAAAAAAGDDLQRGGGRGESEKSENLVVGKLNSVEGYASDSDDRGNRSFNESNSTSQRSDAKQNGVVVEKKTEEREEELDPAIKTETRSEPDDRSGKVIDADDVDDTKEKDEAKPGRPGDNEFVVKEEERANTTTSASAAAAKQQQQNSDVQSSASLSRKRKRRGKGGGGGESSSGEEHERGEEVSPATTKRVKLVKHEPLVKVLRIVRSHRLGSVFERRLRSQESERYRSLIREHVDLHVVQSGLDKGAYKNCTHKFFRDLLLVFNNAVVFFRKAAPEHAAALELRSLVLKEMNEQLPRRQSSVSTVKPNVESNITTTTTITTSARPGKSSTIVVCGKRGSIKALSENKKGSSVPKVKAEVEDKAYEKKVGGIAPVKSGVRKRRTEGGGGGGRSRKAAGTNNEVKTKQHEYGGNEVSAHAGLEEVKTEKKEEGKKKQGAASFLKRIKQNGVEGKGAKSLDGSDDEVKDSVVEEEEEEDVEVDDKKKKRSTTTTGRKKSEVEKKPRVTRSASGNRGRRGGRGQESGGRGKRAVGRPPKKPETSAAGSGKRGRDNGEADQVGSTGRPRKRTRR